MLLYFVKKCKGKVRKKWWTNLF